MHALGAVLSVGGRRYVTVGYRVLGSDSGVAIGYLVVPYPLGFVGPQSLSEVAPSDVDVLVAEGYLNQVGEDYTSALAALLGEEAEGEELGPADVVAGTDSPLQDVGRLLPMGSVVRLQGTDALVVVMGLLPQTEDGQADYLAVPYPMGLVANDGALAFDADAVAQVVHEGFWDQQGETALEALRRYRQATDELGRQFEEFVASLTPERLIELHDEYAFDVLEDEPEPDFPDEPSLDDMEPSAGAWRLPDEA